MDTRRRFSTTTHAQHNVAPVSVFKTTRFAISINLRQESRTADAHCESARVECSWEGIPEVDIPQRSKLQLLESINLAKTRLENRLEVAFPNAQSLGPTKLSHRAHNPGPSRGPAYCIQRTQEANKQLQGSFAESPHGSRSEAPANSQKNPTQPLLGAGLQQPVYTCLQTFVHTCLQTHPRETGNRRWHVASVTNVFWTSLPHIKWQHCHSRPQSTNL